MARESQIQIHRTEAVGATPSGLTSGELAVNLKDQKLFVGLSSGGYLTFNSAASSPYSIVEGGNGIVVGTAVAGTANTYTVSLNRDITGNTLNITGNAIFSGYDSGVTFNGRVSIGNGNPETSGGWGLYRNPDAYNTTPSSGVAGLVDFTKTIASSIDYANRVGGKVAELVPANAYFPGVINVKTVLDIDSITGAGMFLAKAYSSTGQGNLIGQYLGNLGGVPPLYYKNAPGDTPQTAVNSGLERALLVENINVNFQALGLNTSQIGTPFRTLIQYGTWIDNVQAENGSLGGAPAASGSYETTFDKYVRTGYLLRGGTGTSGGATGTYVWSQWKNLVETTDDLGKYGVSTVNGGTGDISITGAGSNAAVVVRSSVAGINRIDARLATTSLTGVASFSSVSFNVGGTGEVTLKNPSTSFGVQGNSGGKADVTLGGNLTLTGSGSIRTEATQDFNGDGVDVVFDNRIATTSLTGVASFHPSHFTVTNGNVVASFSGGVTFTGTPVFSSGLSATGITANSVFTNKLTATNASFSSGVTFTGTPVFSSGLSATGITANSVFTNKLTATNASFASGVTFTGVSVFSSGLSATGITANTVFANSIVGTNASFSSGVTFTGVSVFSSGLSATGITANSVFANSIVGTNASFASGVTFSGGLSASGLVYFTNGLTSPGGIHTVGLTASNGRFTGNLTVDGNTTHTGTVTNTGTQTFNGGIQTTGLTSTGGLSASGLAWFTNGLTSLGGIHTVGLTANTAVFNGLATFNTGLTTTGLATFNSGLTTTGLATFSNGLTARGGISTNGLTANTIFVSNYGVATNGFYFGTQSQGVAISPNDASAAQGIDISGDIRQVGVLNVNNPGTTFAGNVFAPTIKASNIVNQIAVGNATLTGNMSLTSGSNVTMTVVGNQVTIASSGSVGGGGGATTSALNTWTQTQTFSGGIQTTGLTATNGLSASGLAWFTNGLTAPGGIHTVGLTATNGRFTGNLTVDGNTTHTGTVTNTGTQTFNGGIQTTGLTATNGLSASGLAWFTNGLTAPGGIHTVGLTATNGRFTGNLTVDGNTTHTGTVTNTGTQTFNGGIQTTGLTSTGGLSASGLAWFTNGLTSLGGIHTVGLTANTAVFNGLATFNTGLTTTGLATFNSGLTTTGLATFSNGLTARGGISTNGLTANTAVFNGLATFNGTVSGAVKSFNGNDGVVTITGAGQGNGQAIKVTSTVAGTHLIDARLASTSLTGVSYFDSADFTVDAKGYVQLVNSAPPANCVPCNQNSTNQAACEACSPTCRWVPASGTPPFGQVARCEESSAAQILAGSGLGITGISGGSGASLYLDIGNLSAASESLDVSNDAILYYDASTNKSKRMNPQQFLLDQATIFTIDIINADTPIIAGDSYQETPLNAPQIKFSLPAGTISAGSSGFARGSAVYSYVTQNTVKSFNGLTGSVTAVGSVNGCTAAVVITGSASEIEVLNTCPNIVIGLPDNVTISNLNVLSGATFGGNISAKNIVTSVNGATGAITNVAKTNVNNEFTSAQTFNSNVLVSDSILTVYDSGVQHSIILNPNTDRIRFYDDDFGNSLDLYAGGNYGNQVIAFPGVNTTLAGLAVSQTFTDTNTFNALTNFASGISAAGGVTFSGTLNGVTASFTGLLSASQGISASGATFSGNISARNIVTSFNGLTGAVAGVTTSAANIFTALNTFSAGLSASGATFANDIKVNGVNIGLGGGNVASNLGIGKGALTGNSGGLFNTAVGSGAMEIGTNSYSVAFGFNALHSCTGGGINNVALGSNTLSTISSASNNVAIGSNSSQGLVDGNYNVSIGGESLLYNANGSSNLAIGHQALFTNFASNNIGIGYQALYTNDEGQQNTAIGNEALKSIATTGSAERNTAIGYQAGRWRGTGTSVISNRLNTANDSIFIGWRARSSADAQTNQIVIGSNTLGGGSNTTTIGTTGTIDTTIYGKLHGTNGVSGPTASFNSLTVSQNTTLGSTASNTTTIYGAKIVNESIYSNGTLRNVGINFANGQVQTLTGIGTGATGTTAIYFMGAPATGAGNVTLLVTNGGSMTGNTTTWEGRIKWPGGVKPTLSTTGIDVVSFVTPDAGTTIYGFLGGLNFS